MARLNVNKFKEKLSRYSEKDIIFTDHTKVRALFRNMDLEEVKKNILYPERLAAVLGDESKSKYECYFEYSKTYCHKYVLVLSRKVIIVTIININRDWQRTLKK